MARDTSFLVRHVGEGVFLSSLASHCLVEELIKENPSWSTSFPLVCPSCSHGQETLTPGEDDTRSLKPHFPLLQVQVECGRKARIEVALPVVH